MYYFAYGSNMSLEHMRRICGWHCQFLGRSRLPDFGACVDMRGYLNIQEKIGSEVQGILYIIDEDGLSMLDAFEGYPNVFERQEVAVFDEHNVKYKAQIYIEKKQGCGGKQIREEYFRRVIAAAYENKMPAEWVKKLEDLVHGRQKI